MKDLTKGYPAKVIALFALPLIFGNIMQQLYNITDSKIVSEYINSQALAAVGSTAIISNTLIGFINGLTQGFGILVARSFGQKEFGLLRRYIAGTVKLTAAATVILTAVSELFIKKFLILLRTPVDIQQSATEYVRIILAGIIFISIYNMCANILRSVGDSKKPLICLIISIFVNIGLDLLFILKFDMGIKGAAYATIISQAVSAFCCLMVIIVKYKDLIPRKEEWKLSKKQYTGLLAQGASMGFMGCIVNIGSIILQSAINNLGTDYVTAHISGRRVFDIMMIMIFTFGLAMTTYVSQNLGAGQYGRIRQGIRHVLLIDTVMASLLVVFAYTAGDDIVRWIASTDNPEILNSGVKYIQIGVWFFYVLGPLFILRCSLQGMGQKIVPLISSGLELAIKILSAFFIVPRLKYMGVILTEPISWVVMIIPLIIVYIIKRPGENMENRCCQFPWESK